jgi:ABC-2 type transport system ATP-binding protein
VVGVTKSLRGRLILDQVDLTVPRGTLTVMEGSNGAGKTTLVRTLATVVAPDAGTVRVNGYDAIRQSLDVRRSIGVSFANERSLYWRINSFQNLELFGKIAGIPKRVIASRSADLIERLGIAHVASGQVARMSTGQRQRLMVARALLNDPSVILLDEPFRGIDEEGLSSILGLVKERVANGATALIVAPLVDAILPAADATYIVSGGVIRPTGDTPTVGDDGPDGDRVAEPVDVPEYHVDEEPPPVDEEPTAATDAGPEPVEVDGPGRTS